jgi:hypothetical protein
LEERSSGQERFPVKEPLEAKKKVLVVKKQAEGTGALKSSNFQRPAPVADPWSRYMKDKPQSEDDGTMYSPFAEAFKKMQEKKGGKR